jgi:hypothetical protein
MQEKLSWLKGGGEVNEPYELYVIFFNTPLLKPSQKPKNPKT